MLIAIAQQKGGVGKSLIATQLAEWLALSTGQPVALLDTDTQGTARQWGSIGNPSCDVIAGRVADAGELAGRYDAVVIDTAPRLDADQRRALATADLILVPVTPGAADLWALAPVLELIEAVQAIRPVRWSAIVNRADSRRLITGATIEALREAGVPVLSAMLSDRVAFPESVAAGQCVTEYAPGSKAAAELDAMGREVVRLLHGD